MSLLAQGLGFLEGPVWSDNGSLYVVDLRLHCVWQVKADGSISKVVEVDGAPNGMAVGPDGRLYICNNGGLNWEAGVNRNIPLGRGTGYSGGSIQAVDLISGSIETLYREHGGFALKAPNDLVFDSSGGFYFTDHASELERVIEHGGLYYAQPDGSEIIELAYPLTKPNGVALSPDEDRVYVADSLTGNLWFWEIEKPGKLRKGQHRGGATFLARLTGTDVFDSIAVDSQGNILCATLDSGIVSVFNSAGVLIETISPPVPDPFITNVCFGGPGMRTVFVTSAGVGQIYKFSWDCAGLKLNFAHLLREANANP